MRIPGWNKIKKLTQLAAEQIGPRAIILLYHRVTCLEFDPQRLSVHPDLFAKHLQALRERGLEPVHLSELPRLMKARKHSDPVAVAITFDDGYADNLLEAKPLLEKHRVPATVFVTTGFVERGTECWWDELERLLFSPGAKPTELSLRTPNGERSWPTPAQASDTAWDVYQPVQHPLQQTYLELAEFIRGLPPNDRKEALAHIRQWAGAHPPPRPSHRPMSREELNELISGNLLEIGAHTVHHPQLSSLPPEEQHREIMENKQELESILGRPITTFSYPYGRTEDYTSATVRLVREAGFQCACSNFPGRVTRWTDPFQYPRFVIGNWEIEEFKNNLHNFLST